MKLCCHRYISFLTAFLRLSIGKSCHLHLVKLQVDILVVSSFGRKGERMYGKMASAVLPYTIA